MSWKFSPPPRSGKTYYAINHSFCDITSRLGRKLNNPRTKLDGDITIRDEPIASVLSPVIPLSLKAMVMTHTSPSLNDRDKLYYFCLGEIGEEVSKSLMEIGASEYNPERGFEGSDFFLFMSAPTTYFSMGDNPWYESLVFNRSEIEQNALYLILTRDDQITGAFQVAPSIYDEALFGQIVRQWVDSDVFVSRTYSHCDFPMFEDFETEGVTLHGFKSPMETLSNDNENLFTMARKEYLKALYKFLKGLARNVKQTDSLSKIISNMSEILKSPSLMDSFLEKLKSFDIPNEVLNDLKAVTEAFYFMNATKSNKEEFDPNSSSGVSDVILHRNKNGSVTRMKINILEFLIFRRGRGFIDSWTPFRYFNKTEYGLLPGGIPAEILSEFSASQRDGKYLWFWTSKQGGDPFDSIESTNFQTGFLSYGTMLGSGFISDVFVSDRDSEREVKTKYVYSIKGENEKNYLACVSPAGRFSDGIRQYTILIYSIDDAQTFLGRASLEERPKVDSSLKTSREVSDESVSEVVNLLIKQEV